MRGPRSACQTSKPATALGLALTLATKIRAPGAVPLVYMAIRSEHTDQEFSEPRKTATEFGGRARVPAILVSTARTAATALVLTAASRLRPRAGLQMAATIPEADFAAISMATF